MSDQTSPGRMPIPMVGGKADGQLHVRPVEPGGPGGSGWSGLGPPLQIDVEGERYRLVWDQPTNEWRYVLTAVKKH